MKNIVEFVKRIHARIQAFLESLSATECNVYASMILIVVFAWVIFSELRKPPQRPAHPVIHGVTKK